jgi:hypothetical protein
LKRRQYRDGKWSHRRAGAFGRAVTPSAGTVCRDKSGLFDRWRRWRSYQAHMSRLFHEEADTGYKVTRAKLEITRQQARQAVDQEFPVSRAR